MKQKSPNKDKNLDVSPVIRPQGPAARDSSSCALKQSQIGSIRQTPILRFPRCHGNHLYCHITSTTPDLGLSPWKNKNKSVKMFPHTHLQTAVCALCLAVSLRGSPWWAGRTAWLVLTDKSMSKAGHSGCLLVILPLVSIFLPFNSQQFFSLPGAASKPPSFCLQTQTFSWFLHEKSLWPGDKPVPDGEPLSLQIELFLLCQGPV